MALRSAAGIERVQGTEKGRTQGIPQSAKIQDAALELKAAGAITSSAAVATIVDLGAYGTRGDLVITVSAIDLASTDELYTLRLQGSQTSDFSSFVADLLSVRIGAVAAQGGGTDISGSTFRYVLPFTTEPVAGVPFRYVRMYTTVAGTTPSINYTARISRLSAQT